MRRTNNNETIVSLEMPRTHSSRSAVSVTLLVFPDRKYGEDALWIHD